MAVQYATVFSASTIGVGVVAGGPYNCAFVNFGGIEACMRGAPSGAASYKAAVGIAGLGAIDPVAHLAAEKVYLFSGTRDSVVARTVMDAVRDYFLAAHVPASNLRYDEHVPAGHAFVSADLGNACGVNATPYINECSNNAGLYDQPRAILTQIYGRLRVKATKLSAKPVPFDQTPFGGTASGMSATGYVYIPTACRTVRCAVHVVFNGCLQGAQSVGDAVYARVGYNDWADTNKIIVLYPQVDRKTLLNQQGCWDWWGYSGLDFQTRHSTQLAAVHAMVARLIDR